ncbi:MAG: hypothetical protein HQL23_01945 [Candidatus Omnitrophica bacterium]|nr:hypothetical protein [Candidatus Omnitrophota bacterium]
MIAAAILFTLAPRVLKQRNIVMKTPVYLNALPGIFVRADIIVKLLSIFARQETGLVQIPAQAQVLEQTRTQALAVIALFLLLEDVHTDSSVTAVKIRPVLFKDASIIK